MYPRLRPPQRGQTKPFGQRCAVRCSPHRTSSPKRERNSLTVMMDFRFNRLGFFISDILSPFVRLFKFDIHLLINMENAFDSHPLGRGERPATANCASSDFRFAAEQESKCNKGTLPSSGNCQLNGQLNPLWHSGFDAFG